MTELSVPCGKPEAVRAAVQSGADSVVLCLDTSGFLRPYFFTENQFAAAAEYCRIRGVSVTVSSEEYVRDDGIEDAVRLLARACELGADAALISDPGLLRAARQCLPDLPFYIGERNSVRDISGARFLASLGASRVRLAPELSADEMRAICSSATVRTEALCYGQLCCAAGGLCYLGSFTGKRSANLHTCERPCSAAYSFGIRSDCHALSMKIYSLMSHLDELESMGVSAVTTDGRFRRPEYTAILTDICHRSLMSKKPPSEHDMELLSRAFPSAGKSDAYFRGEPGPELFGYIRRKRAHVPSSVRSEYMRTEHPRVPVNFYAVIHRGVPAQLAAADESGNTTVVRGPVPAAQGERELNAVVLQSALYNTIGTPYVCRGVKSSIDEGLYMSIPDISAMKAHALSMLSLKRREKPPFRYEEYHAPVRYIERKEPPDITISVQKASQLSPELSGLKPAVLYVPVSELLSSPTSVTPFWENGYTEICAALPPVMQGAEGEKLMDDLTRLKDIHISQVLCGSFASAVAARACGFSVRGDFTLNITNSHTLRIAKDLGMLSAGISFELEYSDIKAMSKGIDTEIMVYGRLPLMFTGACVIKAGTGLCGCDNAIHLRDRRGGALPVMRQPGCRTVIYSEEKLFLASRRNEYEKLGLWGARLAFSTENAKECVQAAARYLDLSPYEPVAKTRGRY